MWLNQLYKRLMGRTSRQIRRRLSRQRTFIRPRLEKLEDRTLLSAPGGGTVATIATLSATTGQFGGGTSNTQSGSQFIGGSFSVNGGFGSFSNGWGAGGSVSMTGHAGVDASYDVTGGQVSATYNNISLNQNFVQPTGIGQQVYFTPGNTYVNYGTGTFSTTSPQAGAGLALDASVNGSISGSLEMAYNTVFGGSTSFGGSVNQSLISYDTVNGLEVGGVPISSFLSGSNSGGNVSGSLTLSGGLSIPLAGPLFLNLGVSANPSLTSLSESLDLSAGSKNGKIDGGINLGSASEYLPSLTLGSSSLQNGGVLTDSGGSTFASANTQVGALIGGIADTDTIDLGPFSLSLTPVSFTLNPQFSFVQTGTITPYNKLTYDFSSPVVVTLDGQVQNGGIAESSVTFTPGVGSVSFQFEGNPITVTQHWTTGLDYTNKIDLDYTL